MYDLFHSLGHFQRKENKGREGPGFARKELILFTFPWQRQNKETTSPLPTTTTTTGMEHSLSTPEECFECMTHPNL